MNGLINCGINYFLKKQRTLLFLKRSHLIGKGFRLGNNVEIIDSTFGDYCGAASYSSIRYCKIGHVTGVGRFSKLNNCIIKNYCSISWDSTIGATAHPINTISTNAFPYAKRVFNINLKDYHYSKKVIIENDVWIGANSVILPDVKISNGAIIGAGAVVTKDVPPYAIVGGIPAKIIKYRFSRDIIRSLLELKWWNVPIEKIKENINLFRLPVNKSIISKLKLVVENETDN